MLVPPMSVESSKSDRCAKSYCSCWNNKTVPVSWTEINNCCSCGEEYNVSEWKWAKPSVSESGWVVVSDDKTQVTFHPFYSLGTAAAKGDTPLLHNHHYYWEVKILTKTYGTDIMVGVGTGKTTSKDSGFKFTSLLGQNAESYGLSYRGKVCHNAQSSDDTAGFCCGTIVGVRLDLWLGTLEFYLNREPQGVSFYNMRRHAALFPMLCSTAAQSSMRLTYAASWRASLLVDAAKILASRLRAASLPPGLQFLRRSYFWLTLPTGDDDLDEDGESSSLKTVRQAKRTLFEVFPSPYMHGFYVDSVDHNYPLVVWD